MLTKVNTLKLNKSESLKMTKLNYYRPWVYNILTDINIS
jgi:hypothetical protein